MRSQKGMSLVEVMATVTVLAVAILAITFLLQTSSSAARDNEAIERSVQVTRTVMEEIKFNLKSNSSVTVYGQSINLNTIRTSEPPYLAPSLFYPSISDKQYKIEIQSLQVDNKYTIKGDPYQVKNYFRKILVTCVNLKSNHSYELEALVEYN